VTVAGKDCELGREVEPLRERWGRDDRLRAAGPAEQIFGQPPLKTQHGAMVRYSAKSTGADQGMPLVAEFESDCVQRALAGIEHDRFEGLGNIARDGDGMALGVDEDDGLEARLARILGENRGDVVSVRCYADAIGIKRAGELQFLFRGQPEIMCALRALPIMLETPENARPRD
jgi:hypothetical protein